MTTNALLEIFTEHLPARFFAPALTQLRQNAQDILARHNIKFEDVQTLGTFRRLTLVIKGLAAKSEDIVLEVKGPPAKLLKDANGNYTPQALGFAQKNGIAADKLITVETDKGPFIYAKVKIKGAPAAKLLPEIFKEIILSLTFPKNMVWEASCLKFARPIRGLVALNGGKVVPLEVAGVKSGRSTYPISSFGLKPIKITSPDSYAETLRNQPQPILADPGERRKALLTSVNAIAANLGYTVDLDEDLINETVSFTEHPVALAGDMDIAFLTLPKDLVTTVLKKQLRMFPVLDKAGALQPHFIAVRDGVSVNTDEVRTGFKNVMTARLTDAVFFYQNDLKNGLPKMKEKLATVNFIDGMGNLLQKTARIEGLALALANAAGLSADAAQNAQEAASYCLADLTGGVVYEFPELQGYMGAVYAQKAGFKPAVCAAMGEFYLPLSAAGQLPASKAGAVLSLAGKMDTLAANFAMGLVPTGSEDPYALRRGAMGAVRIILENNFNISLRQLVEEAAKLLPAPMSAEAQNQLVHFLWQRFANILEQEGLLHDEIDALSGLTSKTLGDIMLTARALQAERGGADLPVVGELAKRVGNILKKSDYAGGDLRPDLFNNDAETALHTALKTAQNALAGASGAQTAFGALATLKTPLEAFFDKVMVNDPDAAIRANRLALLAGVNSILTDGVADLSKLQKRG